MNTLELDILNNIGDQIQESKKDLNKKLTKQIEEIRENQILLHKNNTQKLKGFLERMKSTIEDEKQKEIEELI